MNEVCGSRYPKTIPTQDTQHHKSTVQKGPLKVRLFKNYYYFGRIVRQDPTILKHLAEELYNSRFFPFTFGIRISAYLTNALPFKSSVA